LKARFLRLALTAALIASASASDANAASGGGVDGAKLGAIWVLPFAGILSSLALLPALAPHFWHRRQGAISLFWAGAFLLPFAAQFGADAAAHQLLHALLLEYIPFIVLIGALYTISGGIYVGGKLHGSPLQNTSILAMGTAAASFVGTTGAAMIFIRPLLRANKGRQRQVHVFVFFIFLVCNIGGALTPLGDPPLFLGYLQGVHFSWPFRYLLPHALLTTTAALLVFFLLDSYYRRKEQPAPKATGSDRLELHGSLNLLLIALLIVAVLASGTELIGKVKIAGVELSGMSLLRDALLVALAVASLAATPRRCRELNEFNWAPVLEVAKLFAAIFVTIIPAVTILKAGERGAFAPLFPLLEGDRGPNAAAYFWLTGILSSFLDNAPTYLVFFNAAGGDAATLMGPMAPTLTAISAGAVFMGAMTYIGNAPNFMVKAIAEHQGIEMPGFFGFMAWSCGFLLPLYLLLTFLFFR
jgi:Na+/H+ antiporter NhaD/arsenite permease-like protein